MLQLSVIITTFNEAEHIADVLESVKWADEIIIVDSFSTDETVKLAENFRSRTGFSSFKILQRKYTSPADQKNWAIALTSHDWILILDADERVPLPLKNEITTLLQQPLVKDAFWIPRQSFFMGKKIKYSGWQGDAVIRLINKKCRYKNVQVHEEIDTNNIQVGRLKNKLEHYTYKDINHFLAKMQRYSDWSAQDYFDKTPRVTFFHLYLKPLFRFFKHYILRRGFLDGKVGFIISVIMAWGVFLRYVKILEKRK
ncbi:MAG TPA: glycosyltransferase family 2 protein [Phaeodactylibacter sp.]|nr:glycosyltransferase family 2 protein [Phaeodactylibacter sp.]